MPFKFHIVFSGHLNLWNCSTLKVPISGVCLYRCPPIHSIHFPYFSQKKTGNRQNTTGLAWEVPKTPALSVTVVSTQMCGQLKHWIGQVGALWTGTWVKNGNHRQALTNNWFILHWNNKKLKGKRAKGGEKRHMLDNIIGISIGGVIDRPPFPLFQECLFVTVQNVEGELVQILLPIEWM